MAARRADLLWITAIACAVTLVLAAAVVRAPADRIFGAGSVGWHHDPFTLMRQIDRPLVFSAYLQPITDLPARAVARVIGPVAAYNWLVLLTFPASAAAAFLLARHLALSRAGAAVAALAFAFSPFHLAHAAYHPHIAQTQWIAIYFLALWRCLDTATLARLGWLAAATAGVTLSNFYGGLIAAVITPVAMLAYWIGVRRRHPSASRPFALTSAALIMLATAGAAYAILGAGIWPAGGAAYAVRQADLYLYAATWQSYLVPPIDHPLVGGAARTYWESSGVGVGMLEQQVYLGFGILTLGLVGLAGWATSDRARPSAAAVPVIATIAVAAFLCSLSPHGSLGAIIVERPAALLYEIAPMFRSYARFAVVVQLMAVLLAGFGVDRLRRSGPWSRVACAALLLLTVIEYAASPLAASRDVLPTAAHRWLTQQGPHARALDCPAAGADAAMVSWLTDGRVSAAGVPIADCAEPGLAGKLAAHGYTHLLVRRNASNGTWSPQPSSRDGLVVAATFSDSRVFGVAVLRPGVYTDAMAGFSNRERDGDWSWRWMGASGAWTVKNITTAPVAATLDVEVSSFHRERQLSVWLDESLAYTFVAAPTRQRYRIGPLIMRPGAHTLRFTPHEPPTVADEVTHNRDRRPLSLAFGDWRWSVEGAAP